MSHLWLFMYEHEIDQPVYQQIIKLLNEYQLVVFCLFF